MGVNHVFTSQAFGTVRHGGRRVYQAFGILASTAALVATGWVGPAGASQSIVVSVTGSGSADVSIYRFTREDWALDGSLAVTHGMTTAKVVTALAIDDAQYHRTVDLPWTTTVTGHPYGIVVWVSANAPSPRCEVEMGSRVLTRATSKMDDAVSCLARP